MMRMLPMAGIFMLLAIMIAGCGEPSGKAQIENTSLPADNQLSSDVTKVDALSSELSHEDFADIDAEISELSDW